MWLNTRILVLIDWLISLMCSLERAHCRGQRITCENLFSPYTMRVPIPRIGFIWIHILGLGSKDLSHWIFSFGLKQGFRKFGACPWRRSWDLSPSPLSYWLWAALSFSVLSSCHDAPFCHKTRQWRPPVRNFQNCKHKKINPFLFCMLILKVIKKKQGTGWYGRRTQNWFLQL